MYRFLVGFHILAHLVYLAVVTVESENIFQSGDIFRRCFALHPDVAVLQVVVGTVVVRLSGRMEGDCQDGDHREHPGESPEYTFGLDADSMAVLVADPCIVTGCLQQGLDLLRGLLPGFSYPGQDFSGSVRQRVPAGHVLHAFADGEECSGILAERCPDSVQIPFKPVPDFP